MFLWVEFLYSIKKNVPSANSVSGSVFSLCPGLQGTRWRPLSSWCSEPSG